MRYNLIKQKTIYPTDEVNLEIMAGIAADPDTSEWSEDDFVHVRLASEFLPELFGKEIAAEFLQPKTISQLSTDSPKIFTSIRLDADVLEAYKATGKDWQSHINQALKEWLKKTRRLIWRKKHTNTQKNTLAINGAGLSITGFLSIYFVNVMERLNLSFLIKL